MRTTLAVLAVAAAGWALAPGALAATYTVTITASGFHPRGVSIVAGDTVRWRNADARPHQVVATQGVFASPVLGRTQAYAFTFTTAGRYDYRDALSPSRTGVVRVAGPPPAVSLGVAQPQIDYGQSVVLAGQVNNRRAGEQVLITAQPYGQPSPIVLATVITGTDGTFSLVTKPQLLTVYQASWKTAKSLGITAAVKPVVSFGRSTLWVTRVYAGRSMTGKSVQVQRLSSFGQWVTIRRVQLGDLSRVRFRLTLPKGVSRLRIAMSVNQAGAGYLAAFSGEVTVRRK